MDRVDRWLNAQRGWRRLLIGWLFFAPVAVDAGLLWSGSGNLDDQGTVPTGSVLLRVVIAVLVAIPVSAVLVRLQLRFLKRRPWNPGFSWRMIAAIYVFMTGMAVGVYGDTRTLAWRHQHVPYNALFLADAAFFVLVIWNALYLRKLRRQAQETQTAAG